MIVTEIYNGQGLGNQLWCYAVTRCIAEDNGYAFGIMHPEKFKCLDFMNLDFGEKVIGGTGPEGGPATKLPNGIKYYYSERKYTHPQDGSDIRMYDKDLPKVLDCTKIDGSMQDEQYIAHRKNDVRKWLAVRKNYECFDYSADDICVINFRGGEYKRHLELFLCEKYWQNAILNMQKINPDFRFVVITDDIVSAKKFFPKYEVHHFNIAKDYTIIKNAKYLILSNSSFAVLPAWLSVDLKYCIAPKYWGRHNLSDGYWSMGQNLVSGFMYQNRDGVLHSYEECKEELCDYITKNPHLYPEPKIESNFLVISNFNNDLRWVPEYTNNYMIYNKRSDVLPIPETIDPKKVLPGSIVGYNSYEYFTYIIDNYDNLPDCVIFAKGWSFPRHVRREYFERVMNNKCFTPLEDYKLHKTRFPISFFSADGGYCEINNSWYLKYWKTKYIKKYNNLLRLVYKDPVIPLFTRFAPGGDYIVPRANILKLPKVVYRNLRMFMSHCQEPGETHAIERAMHTLWTSNFELNPKILVPLEKNFTTDSQKSFKEKIINTTPKFLRLYFKKLLLFFQNRIVSRFL